MRCNLNVLMAQRNWALSKSRSSRGRKECWACSLSRVQTCQSSTAEMLSDIVIVESLVTWPFQSKIGTICRRQMKCDRAASASRSLMAGRRSAGVSV